MNIDQRDNRINKVVVYDGQRSHSGDSIQERPVFVRYVNAAHFIYRYFVDQINECGAYLFVDASDRPEFSIKNAPEHLQNAIKAANVG